MIDAAAILKLMPSPLLKLFCGTVIPGTVRASPRIASKAAQDMSRYGLALFQETSPNLFN